MNFHPSGTKIGGRYEVAGWPLMGGMGIVYLCFDHREQRPVALKTFRPEYLPDRGVRERFLEEGDTWVRLGQHPHIVRCYSVFQDRPRPEVYLVLELVAKEEGRRDASLRSWAIPGRPLPIDQALLIALQVVRGMRHATETIPGFVHRDLKPENVLVGADRLSNAPINRVRVTDFGLVKGLRAEQVTKVPTADLAQGFSRLTRVGSIVGTPAYMAPEQWAGADVDVRADIYALGCILGELLIGRPLAQGRTLEELRQAHQGERVLAAAHAAPDAVRDLLAGCLAVEPDRRYSSWPLLEAALMTTYEQMIGQPAPSAAATGTLSVAERVAAGWSSSAMGASFLDIGHAQRALDFFQRAQLIAMEEGDYRLEVAGLNGLGLAYLSLGELRLAVEGFEQALAIARESDDRQEQQAMLRNLGVVWANLGDSRRAITMHEQALALSREFGDRASEAGALGSLGSAYKQLGEARRAIGYYEEALAISREIGDRRGEGANLGNLGNAYADTGELRRAIGFYEQALVIRRAIGDRAGDANAMGNLGSVYLELGEVRRAIGYFEQALAIHRQISDRHGEGADLGNLGIAYVTLGEVRRAIGYYEEALAISREIEDRQGEGDDLGNLGSAYRQLGDARRAIEYFEEALAIRRKIGDRRGEGIALSNLGSAYKNLGDMQRAIGYHNQALTICREIGDVNATASTSFNLALLHAQRGNLAYALPLAREAAHLFSQMGHAAYAQRAQQLVTQLEKGNAHIAGPSAAEILDRFAPAINDAVAATRGDHNARNQLEGTFDRFAEQGWLIAEPIRRIWAGERNETSLLAGLDESDGLIIHTILDQLERPPDNRQEKPA